MQHYTDNPESYDAVTGKCWFCRTKHSYRDCTTPEAVAYRKAKTTTACEICGKVGKLIIYTKRCSGCFQRYGDRLLTDQEKANCASEARVKAKLQQRLK